MVAHRGAQLVGPENTLQAFRLAIASGFKAVECDVQLTKDGHLVVMNDKTVDRTTNGTGWVSAMNKAKIDQLEVAGGDRVPTLRQVVYEVVIHSRRKLIIEIKADSQLHSKQVARRLASFIKHLRHRYWRYIEVHSCWYEALRVFKQQCPEIVTGAIIKTELTSKDIISIARRTKADGVSIEYGPLSPRTVKDCHTCNLFVDSWAVSDKTVLHRLRPFGFRAIVENFTGKTLLV